MLSRLKGVLRPSPNYSILTLIGNGRVLGVVGVLAFNATMHATSTETFCTSCHEMEENPYRQLQHTSHFANAIGVHATSSDCHLPKEFIPEMIHKIDSSREGWGHITGIIDTPEKHAAYAPAMKAKGIARLQANHSVERRNCHNAQHMLASSQSAQSCKHHQVMERQKKIFIDCHTGMAHPRQSGSAAANWNQCAERSRSHGAV
jgi:cytochrome c-type protein NapC